MTRHLLWIVLFLCCDPVGLDNKVHCYRDFDGMVWTDFDMMRSPERRGNACRSDSRCSPHPDVLLTDEDVRRWCVDVR